MFPLYFAGRARLAAQQLLDHTTLGERLAHDSVDDGHLLTVDTYPELVESLSTGERVLYGILESLAGNDTANLYKVYVEVDPEAAWCAWWALGVLLGRVEPLDPGHFGGLWDALGRHLSAERSRS